MIPNTYYILDTSHPNTEVILKRLYAVYARYKGQFVPSFNADRSQCFIKVYHNMELPELADGGIVASGDLAWIISETRDVKTVVDGVEAIVKDNSTWDQTTRPSDAEVKSFLEGRMPISGILNTKIAKPGIG